MLLPWTFSKLFISLLRANSHHDPTIAISKGGSVGLTSIGHFSCGHSGWGLSTTFRLVVGRISWKPIVIERRIKPREILNLTSTFDHEIIDGGTATRFARRLVELIESRYGLCEEYIHVKQAATMQDR